MSNSLYIAATGPESGKITLVLGMMEALSRSARKIGFFRPVIKVLDPPDNDIQLILNRYSPDLDYADTYVCTYAEARTRIARGQQKELLDDIVSKYKQLESQCDFVLCEGTDYSNVSSALEFGFNAEVASNLGSPMMIVVNGAARDTADLPEVAVAAARALAARHCAVAATVVNKIAPDRMAAVEQAFAGQENISGKVYLLPSDQTLGRLTVGGVVAALGARLLSGSADDLNREVLDCKVAAMQLPQFLDRISDGMLVVTPGDRADIQLASAAVTIADGLPALAGIVITDGVEMSPQVTRLIRGLPEFSLPLMLVDDDAGTVLAKIQNASPGIAPDNERKIAQALGLFESHIDGKALIEQIAEFESGIVTPTMFQYRLIEQARTRSRHIVLAEGAEERILRATEILLRRKVCGITLLGEEAEIQRRAAALGLDIGGARIVDQARSKWLDGVRGNPLHRQHHSTQLADNQDQAGLLHRLQRLPDVPGRPRAGIR